MRKAMTFLVAAAFALSLGLSGAAFADHPTSCDDPEQFVSGDGDVDEQSGWIQICSPVGTAGAGGNSDGEGYVFIDGAEDNPEITAGYGVLVLGSDGPRIGCSGSGSWNHDPDVSCP